MIRPTLLQIHLAATTALLGGWMTEVQACDWPEEFARDISDYAELIVGDPNRRVISRSTLREAAGQRVTIAIDTEVRFEGLYDDVLATYRRLSNDCLDHWERRIEEELYAGFSSLNMPTVRLSTDNFNDMRRIIRETQGALNPETARSFAFELPQHVIEYDAEITFDRTASPFVLMDVSLSGSAYNPFTGASKRLPTRTFTEVTSEYQPRIDVFAEGNRIPQARVFIDAVNRSGRNYCYGAPTGAFLIGYGERDYDASAITGLEIIRPRNDICVQPGSEVRGPNDIFVDVYLEMRDRIGFYACYNPHLTHEDEIELLDWETIDAEDLSELFGFTCNGYRFPTNRFQRPRW